MIQSDFYPTPSGNDKSFMGLAFTAELQSIPITSQDFTQAYWLGWMYWDNLPMQYHVSIASFADGVLTFTDDTKVENVPVGFSIHYDSNLDPYKWFYSGVDFDDSKSKWEAIEYVYSSSASSNFYLPNKLDINTVTWGRLRLIFFGLSEDKTVQLEYVISDVPYEDFSAGNDMTAVVTNSGSYNGTFTITKDDISQYNTFSKVINGVTFNFVLTSYIPPYYRDVDFNSGVQGYSAVHPMVQIHSKSGRSYIEGAPCAIQFQYRDDVIWGGGYLGQGFLSNWSGMVDRLTSSYNDNVWTRHGGYVGSFNVSDLAPFTKDLIVPEGATFYVRGIERSDIFIIARIFTYDEILHSMSLLPRMKNNDTGMGYAQNSDYWYGHVDKDTGEFLGDLINGSQRELLVDWQLLNHNIVDNEFKKDDIPEYVPPTPEDAENIGDKITRPASIGVGGTNGFVTQYALNRSDVAQLGELLWTSFLDQDYWKNYLFSLALDTGTLQLSGLLNFFVSLKVYPFPLLNIDSFSQWGADMYIGTGIVPLHFNSNLHVINNYCDYISGGYIEIPRYFNDYRDYINTEISLYLPFCGTVQLNPGDVVGNRIDIQYAIDFATGGCIAYVDLTTGDGAGYPVGALPGQIGADIPLTATAAGEVAARFIGDGLNVAGMIGGEVNRTASGVAGAMAGNIQGGSGGSLFSGIAGMYGGLGAAMAADLAPGLARQGLQVLQRGAVGAPMLSGGRGFAAFGAPSKPYVQIRRGIYPNVSGLGTVSGLPAAGTYTIGNLSGFVQGDAKVDGLSCPDNEKQKIRTLLASGIYV